jgi:hypothetical protein
MKFMNRMTNAIPRGLREAHTNGMYASGFVATGVARSVSAMAHPLSAIFGPYGPYFNPVTARIAATGHALASVVAGPNTAASFSAFCHANPATAAAAMSYPFLFGMSYAAPIICNKVRGAVKAAEIRRDWGNGTERELKIGRDFAYSVQSIRENDALTGKDAIVFSR